nr:hypothetical protein [Microvirga guangxiensis]
MHRGHCADIDRMQAHAVELQFVMQARHIRELARQAIERLDDHHVERAPTRLCEQGPVTRTIAAGAGERAVLEGGRDLKPLLRGIAAADLDLILDRGIALVLARIAGIDGGALHASSPNLLLS